MADITAELKKECERLSESCLYTSTSFLIWLRVLRWTRIVFIVLPLILGGFAGWKILAASGSPTAQTFTAVCAFVAGLLPSIYSGLKFDQRLTEFTQLAAEYKYLQDRFRQAANVSSLKPYDEFAKDFEPLMTRLERARALSLTPPEWCFNRAQKKVKSGDYSFDADEVKRKAKSAAGTPKKAGGSAEAIPPRAAAKSVDE